jgi:outer membrane protein OmpA-like peptidoglycan-associated protein
MRITSIAFAVVAVACASTPPAPIGNRAPATRADPASPSCRAVVDKRYESANEEHVDSAGRKVIVTESDPCGLVIDMIYFDTGSVAFRVDVADEVAGMLSCLAQVEHVRFRLEIVGHASSDEQDPEALGLARARAVERYLRACGVDAELVARSEGERRPLDRRPSELARAKNRRVEFLIAGRDKR